jgi:outer membrane protein assembly factor BamB
LPQRIYIPFAKPHPGGYRCRVFLLNKRTGLEAGASLGLWALSFRLLALIAMSSPSSQAQAIPTNTWSALLVYCADASPAVAKDQTIYVCLRNGEVRAYSDSGLLKWSFNADREIRSTPAIGSDGTLYFGSRDHKFYAVGPDGKKKWDFKTDAWVDSSPAIGPDGTVYFGSWDQNLYAVNPGGAKKWQFRTERGVVSSPAIGQDQRIYFGSQDRDFYSLTPEGSQAWKFVTAGAIISSPALDRDGSVYFTSTDGFIYALNHEGGLKWRLRTGGITQSSPVIGQNGDIVLGVNDKLWSISSQGIKEWEAAWDGGLVESSPLALADGSVCAISGFGYLSNFSSAGRCNWIYQICLGAFSPTVGSGGTIYTIGFTNNVGCFLNALNTSIPLANSAWPKFRADPRNLGICYDKADGKR